MPQWRKSSYSSESFNCVEVAFASACGANGDCVEIGQCCGDTLVRDSKDPTGPVLRFGDDGWRAFVEAVKAGEFHRS